MDDGNKGNEGTAEKAIKEKMNSAAYIRQKEKAYQRKQKYLQNLTEEQKELKRAKDREYYRKKMAESKRKSIQDMTETERGKQRNLWKENSKKYRQKKKSMRKTACKTNKENSDGEKSVIEEPSTSAVETKRRLLNSQNKNDSSAAGTSNDITSVVIKQEIQDTDNSNTADDRLGHVEIKIEPIDHIEVNVEQDPLSVQEFRVNVKNEFDESIQIEENHMLEIDLNNVKQEV